MSLESRGEKQAEDTSLKIIVRTMRKNIAAGYRQRRQAQELSSEVYHHLQVRKGNQAQVMREAAREGERRHKSVALWK